MCTQLSTLKLRRTEDIIDDFPLGPQSPTGGAKQNPPTRGRRANPSLERGIEGTPPFECSEARRARGKALPRGGGERGSSPHSVDPPLDWRTGCENERKGAGGLGGAVEVARGRFFWMMTHLASRVAIRRRRIFVCDQWRFGAITGPSRGGGLLEHPPFMS